MSRFVFRIFYLEKNGIQKMRHVAKIKLIVRGCKLSREKVGKFFIVGQKSEGRIECL